MQTIECTCASIKVCQFEMSPSAIIAFENIKATISSKSCVKPYDLNSHVTLYVDSSEYSICGVLLQQGHPVMFMSRKLTYGETLNSNVEREALAILWAIELLLRRKFTIQSDHEPLKYIFKLPRNLPKTISARLM